MMQKSASVFRMRYRADIAGMNGVGKDTVIEKTDIRLVKIFRVLGIGFSFFFLLFLVMWMVKRHRFMQMRTKTFKQSGFTCADIMDNIEADDARGYKK